MRIAHEIITRMLAVIAEREDELGALDAVAGDGDHGRGMVRGLKAADQAAADTAGDAGAVLTAAGKAFADSAGGASGALWGALLGTLGGALGGAEEIDTKLVHGGLKQGMAMVMRLGRSKPGDKTLLDALDPFLTALGEQADAGTPLPQAWQAALPAARDGRDATTSLTPRRGRSAALGERSLGTPDPGATSLVYCLEAAGEVLISGKERA
jgi:dihydroxyacetone kinase